MKTHTLTKDDWFFPKDGVPDDELILCLVWEYLRESQKARQLADDWSAFFEREEVDSLAPVEAMLLRRTYEIQVSLNTPLWLEAFVITLVRNKFGARQKLDIPWQSLPGKTRKDLVKECLPDPPVFVGKVFPHLEYLMAALKSSENNRTLLQAQATINVLTEKKEALLLIIDWERYDDSYIKAAFESLIATLRRPPGIKPRVRRASGLGRASEWRGKLNDLGIARLSRFHPRQLAQVMPEAYDVIAKDLSDKGPTAVEKKMASARRRFNAAFHKILPFEKDMPLCLLNPRFRR
jgi:hypothetical protein